MIYFIECAGRIKIGLSADPKIRMNKISADAPFPCTLLGVMHGDHKAEKALHDKWQQLRCHREWFAASKALLEWIEAHAISPEDVEFSKSKNALAGIHIKHGLKTVIAKECGVTRGAVSQWHKIPAEYCGIVSRITGHELHVLRPDIFEQVAA